MNYIDLHCDALTKEGVACVTAENLRAGGCALQCFAAFVDGTKGEGYARAAALCDQFDAMCKSDAFRTSGEEGVRTMLTAEGGEAIGGDLGNLDALYARGVRMLGLTWNRDNALGAANGSGGGLTKFGRECVERMCGMGMIPDVAHGSDGLISDVAEICGKRGAPFVISHAGAREVFFHSRNLSDEGIRAVAESGGVVGLYFVAKFLAADGSAEGQRVAILAHARHIVRVGGEDVLAIGSDFDGAPANAYIRSPADMPKLLFDLERAFGARVAEKIAFGNAKRVLGDFGKDSLALRPRQKPRAQGSE